MPPEPTVPVDPRRILAMGGGGFTMPDQDRSTALDRFVLSLTDKAVPRICFLPTASGDPREQVTRFYERFGDWPCEPSTLSLFHLGRDRVDPVSHILSQDALYIGGGSMRNMLAIWREHGLDEAMRTAWHRGIVLAGLSAGAMCWFEGGITMSGGHPEVVRGIGLLPGSLSVHLDGEPQRISVYEHAVATGELASGFAADDAAAILYIGTTPARCVAAHAGPRVVRVAADGAGGVIRRAQPIHLLSHGPAAQTGTIREQEAVSELRALRAGPRRWD